MPSCLLERNAGRAQMSSHLTHISLGQAGTAIETQGAGSQTRLWPNVELTTRAQTVAPLHSSSPPGVWPKFLKHVAWPRYVGSLLLHLPLLLLRCQ
jgi:hypothetical protein